MYVRNGKRISQDAVITVDDTPYTHATWGKDLASFGVSEVPDPVYPDPELFYWTENEDGTLAIAPKAEEQIAQARQTKLNQASMAHLASTDWYVTRFAETGVPIPDEVKASRQAARDAIVKVSA